MFTRLTSITLLLVFTICLAAGPVLAAEFRSEQGNVIISQSVNDNLIVTGGTVDYRGDVNGDLIVLGGNVDINGDVNGSIIVTSGRVRVIGKVKNNIYAAAGNIELAGTEVKKDVFLAGGGMALSRDTTVAGSAYVTGGSLLANGSVGEDLVASSGNVEIGGNVGRNAKINCNTLKMTSGSNISGDLIYRSPQKAVFEAGSKVVGSIKHTRTEAAGKEAPAPFTRTVSSLLTYLLTRYLMILILALIITASAPSFLKSVASEVEKHPWSSLGLGFLLVAVGPVAVILLLVTILGIPLCLIALALYIFLIYAGKIFVAFWIGEKIIFLIWKVSEPNIYGSVALGLLIIAVLGLIPVVGWLAVFVTTLVGIGGLLKYGALWHNRARRENLL